MPSGEQFRRKWDEAQKRLRGQQRMQKGRYRRRGPYDGAQAGVVVYPERRGSEEEESDG